jgi:hypothetical protein
MATENLDLPEKLKTQLKEAAVAQSRSVNAVLADAVDKYIRGMQWRDLHSYGRQRANDLKLKPSDVERLIAESRSEQTR